MADRTQDGRPLKILTIVEEYSRECLAIVVARWLRSMEVLETLAQLFVTHGVPAHLRSDNGPEFTAELIRLWLEALQVQALCIEPGSPWENGYVEGPASPSWIRSSAQARRSSAGRASRKSRRTLGQKGEAGVRLHSELRQRGKFLTQPSEERIESLDKSKLASGGFHKFYYCSVGRYLICSPAAFTP